MAEIDFSKLPDQAEKEIDFSQLPDKTDISGKPSEDGTFKQGEVPNWASGSPNLEGLYGGVKAIGETIKNIPSSGLDFLKNITTPVIHPVQTAKGITAAVTTPEGRKAVKDFFVNRYGGAEKLSKTIHDDPVGFLTDLSTVFGGIEGAAKYIPGLDKIVEAAKVGSEVTNPVNIAATVTKPIRKAAKEVTTSAVGTLIGYSSESVKEAFKGGKVFTDWMRGNKRAEELLEQVHGVVDDIADQRRGKYKTTMDEISQNHAGINYTPVSNTIDNQLSNFGITVNNKGKLDFSRATMDKRYQGDIQEIYDKVKKWGGKPDDTTVKGMDILKQQLDDYFTEIPGGQNKIDAFLAPIKKQIISSIGKVEPKYSGMLKDYNESMLLQKTIQKAFSTRDPAAAETAVTKVTQALRDNKEFRTHLVETMDSETGAHIKEALAGYQLRGYLPQSWIGRTMDLGAIFEVGSGAISPKFLGLLTLSSPRIVGEFSRALGAAYRFTSKTGQWLPSSNKMFQAGRMANIVGNEQKNFQQQITGQQ